MLQYDRLDLSYFLLKMFQYMSDLHLETRSNKIPQFSISAPYLVLAGDIGHPFEAHYERFLKRVSRAYEDVFLIAGNHEYHQQDRILSERKPVDEINEKIYSIVEPLENVHFLLDDVVQVGDLKVIGSTFWYPAKKELGKEYITRLSDYSFVLPEPNRLLTWKDVSNWHRSSLKFLEKELNTSDPVLLITHHAGSEKVVGKISKFSHAYANDYERLMRENMVWINGHTHVNRKETISGCRVVSNCLGYPEEELGFEDSSTIDLF